MGTRAVSKYYAKKERRGALVFDSIKEARRFDELLLLLRAGEIKDLRLQQEYTLMEAFTNLDGTKIKAIRYRADFVYQEKTKDGWRFVVEDVKGFKTREYELKKKLMADRFGITVREV